MKIAITTLAIRFFTNTVRIMLNGLFFLIAVLFPSKSIKHNEVEIGAEIFTSQSNKQSKVKMDNLCTFTEAKVPVLYKFNYRNLEIKRLVWQFKYYKNKASREALEILGDHLYDELVSIVSDRICAIPFQKSVVLVHCPSSTYFKGEKDFDHMKELLLYIDYVGNTHSKGFIERQSTNFFTICTHAILPNLKSGTQKQAQHFGNRAERFKWSKDRFIISERFEEYFRQSVIENPLVEQQMAYKPHIPYIYCIDDVVTTGASFEAISAMLQCKLGVNVNCVALCH